VGLTSRLARVRTGHGGTARRASQQEQQHRADPASGQAPGLFQPRARPITARLFHLALDSCSYIHNTRLATRLDPFGELAVLPLLSCSPHSRAPAPRSSLHLTPLTRPRSLGWYRTYKELADRTSCARIGESAAARCYVRGAGRCFRVGRLDVLVCCGVRVGRATRRASAARLMPLAPGGPSASQGDTSADLDRTTHTSLHPQPLFSPTRWLPRRRPARRRRPSPSRTSRGISCSDG
jgi:hypothetical protein